MIPIHWFRRRGRPCGDSTHGHLNGNGSVHRKGSMEFRLTFGDTSKREVVVTYSRTLRLLRIVIDGRVAYRHCRLVPWARRKADDFKTAGPEAHCFVVEPPGSPSLGGHERGGYRIWLDGTPVLRIAPS